MCQLIHQFHNFRDLLIAQWSRNGRGLLRGLWRLPRVALSTRLIDKVPEGLARYAVGLVGFNDL